MGTFLSKGTTYTDVTQVTPINLNAHVDNATIAPTAISSLPAKSSLAGTEEVMVNDAGTLKKAVFSAVSTFVAQIPVGMVSDYAGIIAPTGWFMCYGQAVSRTTYSALFTAIGATYGSGDGATTFNLPDCRGRVTAGKDDMGGTSANRIANAAHAVNGDTLGAAGGLDTHDLTTGQMPSHTHALLMYPTASENPTYGAGTSAFQGRVFVTAGTASTGTTAAGGGAVHNNLQPTIVLQKIIKY